MTRAAQERCQHGCLASLVCPHCDPHGFLVAYAKTRNALERYGHSDEDIERMVQEADHG